MVTDVELNRALNALSVTLNDQKAERLERERVQEIVTGALAGNEELVAAVDPDGGGLRAWLLEGGERVASVWLDGGAWRVERHRAAVDTHAYIPAA